MIPEASQWQARVDDFTKLILLQTTPNPTQSTPAHMRHFVVNTHNTPLPSLISSDTAPWTSHSIDPSHPDSFCGCGSSHTSQEDHEVLLQASMAWRRQDSVSAGLPSQRLASCSRPGRYNFNLPCMACHCTSIGQMRLSKLANIPSCCFHHLALLFLFSAEAAQCPANVLPISLA